MDIEAATLSKRVAGKTPAWDLDPFLPRTCESSLHRGSARPLAALSRQSSWFVLVLSEFTSEFIWPPFASPRERENCLKSPKSAMLAKVASP